MSQQPMRALRQYAAVDTGSRVEGASPHQLVKVLFDELILALDTSALALRAGDRAKCLDRQTRALAILHALETSLDFERGGEIATNLAVVYREVRRRVLEATTTNDAVPMEAARGFIGDIADAWNQIG
ncbi:flagellar protein FliS [Sphingobium sp. B1D3A]|uniref:Flagellar secretion chaperone FliS n=2 Tax=Sphingomonadaceae TaxID=41297 RepID=A0ABR6NAH0_9SPHN|nr:flagellar protein FliS [Sphingobium lignivorans]